MVLGDTYTAPLVAMASRRAGVGVVHVEAGLRSFNDVSMEESNRRMMASLATLHLAPTELARRFLLQEAVDPSRVRVVGNPVLDAVRLEGVARVPIGRRAGVLVTAHRATNVDDPERLAVLVRLVEQLAARHGGVVFPVHPRTRDRLVTAGLWEGLASLAHRDGDGSRGVHLVEPMGYGDLLRAMAASAFVVTDSGGIQEEASYLGVPVVVMRTTTPRWEGVQSGAAVLTGLDEARVLDAAAGFASPAELARVAALPCPYGDGRTAERVVEVLAEPEVAALLQPREPRLAAALPARVPS